VLFKRIHKQSDVVLVVDPVLLELLDLILSLTERLIELLDVLLRMEQLLVAVGELLQILGYCVIKLSGFSHKYLLHREKIPVLAN
jgi:hypothetical protein